MTDKGSDFLRIYLHDHVGAAAGGAKLVRRIRDNNDGTHYHAPLARLADEIEQDLDVLRHVLESLDHTSHAPLKEAASWLGVTLGGLKLNGKLTEYSPLSRVIELEALQAGINAKARLWHALERVKQQDSRLAGFDFSRLEARASDQVETVLTLHTRAVSECFTPT